MLLLRFKTSGKVSMKEETREKVAHNRETAPQPISPSPISKFENDAACHHWKTVTTLVIGDGMLNYTDEKQLDNRGRVRVRSVSGSTTHDLKRS